MQHGNIQCPTEGQGNVEAAVPEADLQKALEHAAQSAQGSGRKRKRQPKPASKKARKKTNAPQKEPQRVLAIGDHQRDAHDFLSFPERVEAAVEKNAALARHLKHLLAQVTRPPPIFYHGCASFCPLQMYRATTPQILFA